MNILVDSNVLVFAINRDSAKHLAAQAFLRKHTNSLVVAHQNILETYRVLTHPSFSTPMLSADAKEAIDRITASASLIAPNYKSLALWQALTRKHSLVGNSTFDAYLAATALVAGITTIATDNTKDFRRFEELKLLNPFQVN